MVKQQDSSIKYKKKLKFGEQKNAKSWRRILIIILAFGFLVLFTGYYLDETGSSSNIIYTMMTFSLIFILTSLFLLLFIFNRKFYNTIIYLIAMVILGFFFKSQHFLAAGAMLFVGLSVSIIGFFFMAFVSLFNLKDNKFLRSFGFVISLIFIFSFLGGLFRSMHWPGGGYLIGLGTILFLIGVIAMVFTLPNSNYIKWTSFHKKFFYRAIIVPMFFLFIASVFTFIFPKQWNSLFTTEAPGMHWNMDDVQLHNKEGLKKE